MRSLAPRFLNGLNAGQIRAAVITTVAAVFGLVCQPAGAALDPGVPLSDSPLFSAAQVPANLLLELSVEYPTALSIANSQAFNPSAITYLGYFDPNLCYTYVYSNTSLDGAQTIGLNTNAATATTASYYLENANQNDSGDYFKPASLAGAPLGSTAGQCDGKTWSGAFMNWAAMQTIDPFRWALTGGYRSYDVATPTSTTAPSTVLKKAWASGSGGSGETPITSITNPQLYTPMPATINRLYMRVWGLGTRMQFANSSGAFNGNNQDTSEQPWTFSGQGDGTTNDALAAGSKFSVKVRVSACDNSVVSGYTLPSGCTPYPPAPATATNYKPEGLIQQYSTAKTVNNVYVPPQIRFGAMGYLNDSSIYRDAGVLRAKMKFLGPTSPTPGNVAAVNASPEWSPTTGVFIQDPDPLDSAATNALGTCTGPSGTISCASYSGVSNYLNGFGEITHAYKTYDPVNELYYAGIRYFKADGNGGGNVAPWSSLTGLNSSQLLSANRSVPSDSDLGRSDHLRMPEELRARHRRRQCARRWQYPRRDCTARIWLGNRAANARLQWLRTTRWVMPPRLARPVSGPSRRPTISAPSRPALSAVPPQRPTISAAQVWALRTCRGAAGMTTVS